MTTTKAEVLKLIVSSAEKIRQQGEAREQAFARYITKTDEGRALYSIYKRAPGPDHSSLPVPMHKAVEPPKSALRKLLTRADAIAKAENTTTEIAFAKIYSDPANRDLVVAEKRERLGDAA